MLQYEGELLGFRLALARYQQRGVVTVAVARLPTTMAGTDMNALDSRLCLRTFKPKWLRMAVVEQLVHNSGRIACNSDDTIQD